MIEVSKQLIAVLTAYVPLTNVVNNKIYPVLANEGVQFPFAVYSFGEVPFETKDACAYHVNLSVWFEPNKITEAMQMADALKELIDQNDWDFVSTNVNFDETSLKIFSEINFKIIK